MKTQRAAVPEDDVRRLRALEKPVKPIIRSHAGLKFHLVYPNSYWVAMSNLGFQAVYGLLAQNQHSQIERAFLPEDSDDPKIRNSPWRTFESGKLVGDCDVLAFSLSFETDYPHLVRILKNSQLMSLSAEERDQIRGGGHWGAPLILGGGTALTLNPEPIADLIDVAFIGEAEEFIPELVAAIAAGKEQGLSRVEMLRQLAQIEGVYVPRFYQPKYAEDGRVIQILSEPGVPQRPTRRFVKDLSKFPTYSNILTPETEFKSMFLTETGRGCEMGCRFCVAGYIYRPVRKRSEQAISQTIDLGLQNSDAIGFVGAAVSSHKSIAKLASQVAEKGGRASLSSLMSQKVSTQLAASISESEYRTVALAPEAGSERLRRAAGKRVSNQQVLDAASELARAGIRGFKLYFIVGLPTETDADVQAIADLAKQIRELVSQAARESTPDNQEFKQPWVVLSVNPFIPKACTPFQWDPMLERKQLEKKIEIIRQQIKRVPNVELHFESPKESYFQALLSRGDRRVAQLLVLAENQSQDWKWLLQQAQKGALENIPKLEFYTSRRIPFDELLPWEVVDSRIEKSLLKREAERAHASELSEYAVEQEPTIDQELVQTALFG